MSKIFFKWLKRTLTYVRWKTRQDKKKSAVLSIQISWCDVELLVSIDHETRTTDVDVISGTQLIRL
jgi:hypothetical protein